MDGYSLVYLKTSFFVIIPRRRPLWVTRVWEEFFTDYDMKASHISWYQSILQPPTCRRPSLRNMSTTVSMGVWKGRHWYKVLGCKTTSCHSLDSDLDLVGDSDWGKIDNLPQLDRRRAASYHWHVVGENTKAGGKSFLIPRLKRIIDPIHHHLWWIWDIKIGSYKAKKKRRDWRWYSHYLAPGRESRRARALSIAKRRSRRRTNPTRYCDSLGDINGELDGNNALLNWNAN